MRRLAAILGLCLAAPMLAAFTDGEGIFSIAIDPGWKMVGKSGSDTFHFVPGSDRSQGGLIVGAYPAGLPSLHDEIADNFGAGIKFAREAPAVVLGKDCLYAETRQATPGGVGLTAHHLYCFVATTYSGAPKYVFAMSVVSPDAEADAFNAVFWRSLRSIGWGPSVK